MVPFTYCREEHSREDIAKAGAEYATAFAQANKLPSFSIRWADLKGSLNGCYLARGAQILLKRSLRVPPAVPGFSWSYPGYRCDMTSFGIIAHEMGHHLWLHLARTIAKPEWLRWKMAWLAVLVIEKPLTSYEPSSEEAFAEAIRLFVTNPDMLRRSRPLRYGAISYLDVKPVHCEDYLQPLGKAHEKWVAAAKSFVAKESRIVK